MESNTLKSSRGSDLYFMSEQIRQHKLIYERFHKKKFLAFLNRRPAIDSDLFNLHHNLANML